MVIPATSAPSESIFSQANDIITKKRNKLNKDTFKMIMCLKNWGIIKDEEEEIEEIEEIEENNEVEEEKEDLN